MSEFECHRKNVTACGDLKRVLNERLLRELVLERAQREVEGKTGYPEDTIARIETSLREFQSECDSGLPFHDLMALMNGETGSLNTLYHEDALFQSKKIDAQALWSLYGAMLYVGEDPEDAARYTYIYYHHCCEQDERSRKFASYPEVYRQNQLRDAISAFNKGAWNRWFNRKHPDGFDPDDYENWTGDYSDTTYNTVRALVYIACTDLDPEFILHDLFELDYSPSSEPIVSLSSGEYRRNSKTQSFHKIGPGGTSSHYRSPSGDLSDNHYVPIKVVVEAAMELDNRSERTYENAIRRLRKNGLLKWAEIKNGVDYRIYPINLPDPPEAELIKFEGEQYTPEPQPEEDVERESEPKLMTDGGQPIEYASQGESTVPERDPLLTITLLPRCQSQPRRHERLTGSQPMIAILASVIGKPPPRRLTYDRLG